MKTITNHNIKSKSNSYLSKGFKGKALVAFVDLLGFSQEIINEWHNVSNDPLSRLMEIKAFVELARQGNQHTFLDYDITTVLGRSKYPDIITFSDAFVFVQTIEEEDDLTFILSLLAITGSIIELWRIAKDKGFTIRGGVEYGELFYSDLDIVGPAFINSYLLESKIADVSRIVYSKSISTEVSNRHYGLHRTLLDYLTRYFKMDIDEYIILNPLIPFGYRSDPLLDSAMQDFIDMRDKCKIHKAKNKYESLIQQLEERDRNLGSINMFR